MKVISLIGLHWTCCSALSSILILNESTYSKVYVELNTNKTIQMKLFDRIRYAKRELLKVTELFY